MARRGAAASMGKALRRRFPSPVKPGLMWDFSQDSDATTTADGWVTAAVSVCHAPIWGRWVCFLMRFTRHSRSEVKVPAVRRSSVRGLSLGKVTSYVMVVFTDTTLRCFGRRGEWLTPPAAQVNVLALAAVPKVVATCLSPAVWPPPPRADQHGWRLGQTYAVAAVNRFFSRPLGSEAFLRGARRVKPCCRPEPPLQAPVDAMSLLRRRFYCRWFFCQARRLSRTLRQPRAACCLTRTAFSRCCLDPTPGPLPKNNGRCLSVESGAEGVQSPASQGRAAAFVHPGSGRRRCNAAPLGCVRGPRRGAGACV